MDMYVCIAILAYMYISRLLQIGIYTVSQAIPLSWEYAD